MIKYKFSRQINKEFASTLKQRVRAYFKDNQISPGANPYMFSKTIFAFSVYLIPYFFILFAGIENIPLLFLLWGIMGIGKGFIGTSVMHDAIHGSYSKNKFVNKLMSFSAIIVGVDPEIWRIQHNVLHHTYTNIEHADEDIAPGAFLRLSPHQPHKWFHRFQHLYVVFFYSIPILMWVTIKDFVKLFVYHKKGFIKSGKDFWKHLFDIVVWKSLFHAFFLVLPIYVLNIPTGMTISMFVFMHILTGLMLSFIFQTAHVMPELSFLSPEEEAIPENWVVHQLETTTNYAMNNKLVFWLFGGLNYQVEHHLFPYICHVHYPAISRIVRQTTEEFGLPYHTKKSFRAAVASHFHMLKSLGRAEYPAAEGLAT